MENNKTTENLPLTHSAQKVSELIDAEFSILRSREMLFTGNVDEESMHILSLVLIDIDRLQRAKDALHDD